MSYNSILLDDIPSDLKLFNNEYNNIIMFDYKVYVSYKVGFNIINLNNIIFNKNCIYKKDLEYVLFSFYNKGIIFIIYDSTNLGFFFKNKEVKFLVWNSELLNSIICLNIVKDDKLESEYLSNDFTGHNFKPNEFLRSSIIIPKDGELQIDGDFKFVFDNGQEKHINLTGYRVIIFVSEYEKVEEEFKFNTVISITKNKSEYRSLMTEFCEYNQTINYKSVNVYDNNLLNTLKFAYGKVCMIPFHTEIFTINTLDNDSLYLKVNESLNDCFIINNYDIKCLLIVNKNDYNEFYVVSVNSIDTDNNIFYINSSLNLTNLDNYIVFPASLFVLKNIEVIPENGMSLKIKSDFTYFKE